MGSMLRKIKSFIQKEAVLSAAALLAVLSMFWVRPDKEYAEYIDFRTLSILFCLMSVMAGLQKMGLFRRIAERLLRRVHGNTPIILILVMLCFFFGMFITNDVALITFVPFTFTVGALLGEQTYRRMVLPVVALQTVAANLGSMLTPIGNPQNLYLYGVSGMSAGSFLLLMLPYTVLAFVLLLAVCAVYGRRLEKRRDGEGCAGEKRQDGEGCAGEKRRDGEGRAGEKRGAEEARDPEQNTAAQADGSGGRVMTAVYLSLFVLCLLTVAHILPALWMFVLVTGIVFLMDKKVLARVDYTLLATFVAFFVFIGNMGRVPAFAGMLRSLVKGHEVLAAVLSSQFISNVPAALLLSGFTDNIPALIIGVNFGGMGTLIASMASLISYKYVAAEVRRLGMSGGRGKYLGYFTAACVCFLAALVVLYKIWN